MDEKATTPSLLNASLSAVRRAPVADLHQLLKTIRSFCVANSSNFAVAPAFENKTADICRSDDARNSLRLRHALLLHEQFQGPITPAAGRQFEHPGLIAFTVDDCPNVQALQQGALRDAFGELLDRNAGLHAPHVALTR